VARRSIRASRLVTPSNQADRGARPAPHRTAEFWCAGDHLTSVPFAAEVELPAQWLCHTCGAPAGPIRGSAPETVRQRVFPRTPYEFLMMRRSESDADRLLAEAVTDLRRRRRTKT
jgi:hypothetical protein